MATHYDGSYKGITYIILRNGREYYGYINDPEYSFTATDDDRYEVERRIINFIDQI